LVAGRKNLPSTRFVGALFLGVMIHVVVAFIAFA
jgi:hypothetical protein